jgi:hypothetical protein
MSLETYYLKLAKGLNDLTPLIAEVKALHSDAIASFNEQVNQSIALNLFVDWVKSDTPIIQEVASLRNAVEALQNEANRRHVCNRIL